MGKLGVILIKSEPLQENTFPSQGVLSRPVKVIDKPLPEPQRITPYYQIKSKKQVPTDNLDTSILQKATPYDQIQSNKTDTKVAIPDLFISTPIGLLNVRNFRENGYQDILQGRDTPLHEYQTTYNNISKK